MSECYAACDDPNCPYIHDKTPALEPMRLAPHIGFPKTIKAMHFERGEMRVYWSVDYMYYLGESVWIDDNSDGVCYPEEEFLGWLK